MKPGSLISVLADSVFSGRTRNAVRTRRSGTESEKCRSVSAFASRAAPISIFLRSLERRSLPQSQRGNSEREDEEQREKGERARERDREKEETNNYIHPGGLSRHFN